MSPAPGPPFSAFYFDCDSTLSTVEGVDELLRILPEEQRNELRDLTRRAMEGSLPLDRVYETRLSAIAPTRAQLATVGEVYAAHLTEGAETVLAALRFLGKEVGIVSGGLELPVRVLAGRLGVPLANVHAVPVLFDEQGRYRDFDRRSPLWRNRGKVDVLAGLPAGHRPVLYVGDGVTDLEAQGTVDLFVGFGGVEVRDRVREQAQVWLPGPSLTGLLGIGLTAEEQELLRAEPRFRSALPPGRGSRDAGRP